MHRTTLVETLSKDVRYKKVNFGNLPKAPKQTRLEQEIWKMVKHHHHQTKVNGACISVYILITSYFSRAEKSLRKFDAEKCFSHAYDPGNFQHSLYLFDADYGKYFKENYPAPTSEYLMRRKIA